MAGKVVVILGATGNVGSGAAHAFLQQGTTVVLVGRDKAKLNTFKDKLPNNQNALVVVGKFNTEKEAAESHNLVLKALGGKSIDHVISAMGFFDNAPGWPTATPLHDVHKTLHDFWDPHFCAAHAFLPGLKDREGTSYTIISGGAAHITPAPALWLATLKSSMTNTLVDVLAAETADNKVRVNSFCIHFGVAEFGGKKNQIGLDAVDTRELGPFFVNLSKNEKIKGKILHGITAPEAFKLVE